MLAYVFAHRPGPRADVGAYEDSLRQLHETLGADRPAGFIKSLTYRIGDAYSDWYLVENSAALDSLNLAAVTGARSPAHDAVAHVALDGAGKLMTLMKGDLDTSAAHEVRFAKPAGTAYADLYRRLEPWTGAPDVSLWRRMMVLGPPPEFCLVSPSPIKLPAEMRPESLSREIV